MNNMSIFNTNPFIGDHASSILENQRAYFSTVRGIVSNLSKAEIDTLRAEAVKLADKGFAHWVQPPPYEGENATKHEWWLFASLNIWSKKEFQTNDEIYRGRVLDVFKNDADYNTVFKRTIMIESGVYYNLDNFTFTEEEYHTYCREVKAFNNKCEKFFEKVVDTRAYFSRFGTVEVLLKTIPELAPYVPENENTSVSEEVKHIKSLWGL